MYKIFSRGLLGSNSYLVYDGESREAMIVDLGNPPSVIQAAVREHGLDVKYVVLTHAHFDHADYIDKYKAAFPGARIVAHEKEIAVMTDSEANVSLYFGTPKSYGYPDLAVKEGDVLTLGSLNYRVLHTPGHTPGSICLYSADESLMLTGDTLFEAGRGRCDLKYGSEYDMAKSLQRLFSMDAGIVFLSGHGGVSTIGRESGRVF